MGPRRGREGIVCPIKLRQGRRGYRGVFRRFGFPFSACPWSTRRRKSELQYSDVDRKLERADVTRIIDGEKPYVARVLNLLQVKRLTEHILHYRKHRVAEKADGPDAVRHNFPVLRNAQLPDTRLIICSKVGQDNYPDID